MGDDSEVGESSFPDGGDNGSCWGGGGGDDDNDDAWGATPTAW